MRAIRIPRHGGPEVLSLDQIAVPRPDAGQVTIDVAFAGVNFADIMYRRGTVDLPLPLTPGIEVSGHVRELGAGVTHLAVGQPVAGLCIIDAGGYAEVVALDARLVAVLPGNDEHQLAIAAGTPSNTTTAVMALRRTGRLTDGETVLVHSAAGGLGSQLGQVASSLNAATVIGTVGHHDKIEAARRFGFDTVVLREEWLADPTIVDQPDLIIDPVGGASRAASLNHLRPDGRLVVIGNASNAADLSIAANELFFASRTVAGYSLGAISAARPDIAAPALRHAVELVSRGDVHVDVNTILDLEQASEAHRRVESGATIGKTVLRIHG